MRRPWRPCQRPWPDMNGLWRAEARDVATALTRPNMVFPIRFKDGLLDELHVDSFLKRS